MKNYHVTIMSIDPNDHSEDPHQKYGLSVQATSQDDAIKKGAESFKKQYAGLPIYWVKAFENN
jgi:hypothetical protein